MVKITYIQSNGKSRDVDVPAGTSLMLGAVQASVQGIDADCGGCLSCATCHIFVEPGFLANLPPMLDDEDAMLDEAHTPRQPNSRLSCQVEVSAELEGLVVHIPEAQS